MLWYNVFRALFCLTFNLEPTPPEKEKKNKTIACKTNSPLSNITLDIG